jgi:hypothetical protein
MPLFDEHKCLFIHIPKTAGMSMEKALGLNMRWPNKSLKKLFGPHNGLQLQHITCSQALTLNLIPKNKFNNYFKFAFVRNPYDRAVSEYHFDRRWNKKTQNLSFVQFLRYMKNNSLYCHYMPQYLFIHNNNKLQVDFVGKFENLEEDWAYIANKLNLKDKSLPFINKGDRKEYMSYYDEESIKLVNEIYKHDFVLLNYEKL